MKAIILTAGSGQRMRPLTDAAHKTLLKIRGRTVIQWIVDALLDNGITEIVVVTGYQAEALRAHLEEVYPQVRFTYVHNARFAQTNNIYSMALALDHIELDSDLVLMECDLIVEPSVIRRLLASPHPNAALLDHYRMGMDGTVVTVADGVITEVIPPHRQGAGFSFDDKYKTLNIYRFSKEFCAGPFKKLLSYYASVINDNVFYELVLGIIIYLQHATIHAEILNGEKWAELDDPNDVNEARFHFDSALRQHILERSCGGHWNYDILDFCFIRNMYFPTGAILSELRNMLPALVQSYGSAQPILNQKLAYYLLCRPERLMVLNGASQAYPWLQSFFAGRRVLIPRPTFGEYPRMFPSAGCYADEVGVNAEEIIRLAPGHDVIVLVNPNNPTGSVWPTERLYEFAVENPEKQFVVDESFIEFSGQPSMLSLLEAKSLANVILLKSLSKALGVPGLRLGYVYTAHEDFLELMRRAMPIWNLNALAECFLEIILKHRPALQASFEQTIADRNVFAEELAALPLVKRVHPSGGNFLLVELRCSRTEAETIAGRLLCGQNIYIKDVSARFQQQTAFWRLAVRLPEENSRLACCLEARAP